jgi:hypothetical protein
MASKNQITLAQVLELVPGTDADPTWVDDFEAIVTVGDSRTTNTGKQMWNCILSDPNSPGIQLPHVFWDNPTRYHGALCLFSGSMRMCEYQGKPQLKTGKKTLVAVKVAGTDSARPPAHQPQPSHAPAPQSAGNGQQSSFISGLNKLATLWCHCWDKTGAISQKVGGLTPEQRQSACASLFIEANRKGLADGPIPPFGQPAPQPQPAPPPPQPAPAHQRPKAGPDGQAFNPEADFDSSVDF